MKTKYAIASILLALSLVSCGKSGLNEDAIAAVSGNEIGGKDMGIPFVKLTNIYDPNYDATELRSKAYESLSLASGAVKKTYSYQYDDDYLETETRGEVTAKFYGFDKQYATVDLTTNEIEKAGGAYEINATSSEKYEFVLSKDHYTYLSKKVSKSASGLEETTYSYRVFQDGSADKLRSNCIQKQVFGSYFSLEQSGGVIGTDSNGKLYAVYYSESFSPVNAYDKEGQSTSGASRTYTQYLVDLNVPEDPRYMSLSYVRISETNVGRNRVRDDSFHVTAKSSYTTSFTYDPIKENEESRAAFLDAYPAKRIESLKVNCVETSVYVNPIGPSKVTGTEDQYKATVALSTSRNYTFTYSCRLNVFDKAAERVTSQNLSSDLPLSNVKITDISSSGAPRVSVSNNTALVASQNVTVNIYFKSSTAEPYLKITEIEVQ